MATYNINDLTIRNGRIYSGNTEIGARDTIGYFDPATSNPDTPSWLSSPAQPHQYSQLPVWALNSDRLSQFMPSSPQAPEGYQQWLSGAFPDPTAQARNFASQFGGVGDYYSSQVDPILEFANTGNNRNFLYGAYGSGANTTNRLTSEGDIPWMNSNVSFSDGLFDRQSGIPDLSKWTGEEYTPSSLWIGPASEQSSQDAQKILHMLYPNVSQSDMDKAAYAAMQKGDKYYSGTSAPSENTQNDYYYGHGPLPVVTAIAKQLGMTPEAEQFINSNWANYANKYADLRHEAKANASAEDKARMMEGIKAAGIFGGLALGGATGFGGLFGEGTGGSMFDGFGDWISNLFSSGTDATDFLNSWLPGDIGAASPIDWGVGNLSGTSAEDFLNNWLGNDPSIASPDDWGSNTLVNNLKEYISSNPGSTIKSAIQALTGGSGGSLLGALGGGLLGLLNGSQKAGDITTTQVPWGPQQPYLLDAFEKAKQASNGGALQTQANTNYENILNGSLKNPYLGQDNPYLTKAIDYANEDVTRAMMPAMNQANHASGSFGNSGVADQFGTAMTNQFGRNATNMRMQDYTQQQQLAESDLNRRANFTMNTPDFLSAPSKNYAQTIQGNYGGSTSQPYFNNQALSGLGGALTGSQIFKNLGF